MNSDRPGTLRPARAEDAPALISLWQAMFEELGAPSTGWQGPALDWLATFVADRDRVRPPVIEVGGGLVASAVGSMEIGVPNPTSPTGRAVRLANVTTLPPHRGRGYATQLVSDVMAWAEQVGTDRIDLSATPQGLQIYQRLGFSLASAPRMKKIL